MISRFFKKILFSGITAIFLLGFYACSDEENQSNAEKTGNGKVEFILDSKKLMDTRLDAVDGYNTCNPNNEEMYVTIKLSKIEKGVGDWDVMASVITHPDITKKISSYGGDWKTDPEELDSKYEYRVDLVTVHDQAKTTTFHSSVEHDANYAAFIPEGKHNREILFSVTPYTKETASLFVLCALGEDANDFGMPKFEINRTDVTCFDIFINVCDANGEHMVGEGTISLFRGKRNSDGIISKSEGAAIYTDDFGEGNLATLCFPDNISIPNKDDYSQSTELFWVEATFTNYEVDGHATQGFGVTLEQLLMYKDPTNSNWDASMNAVHLWLCGTPFSCIVPGTCDPVIQCPDFTCVDFNDFPVNAAPAKLYDQYGWIKIIPAGGHHATETVRGKVADASDHYLEIKDSQCQTMSMVWRSPVFDYKNGDVFTLDMWIKDILETTTRSNLGYDKVDVSIGAADQEGGLISALQTETVTVSISEFLDNTWKTLTFTPDWTSGCLYLVLSITPTGSTYWSHGCGCPQLVWGEYDGAITVRLDNICFK